MHPEDEASEPAPGGGQKPRYEVMATPSFTPGPDESPLMTWGDLAGTPLRLEAEDDIHVSAGEAGKLCCSSGFMPCTRGRMSISWLSGREGSRSL